MPGYRTASGVHYYEQDYTEVIKSLDPISYWPMGERFGSTAYDVTGNEFNGAITGATLGEPGIGDGLTSMFFDGVNDFINIYSAAFAAAWVGNEVSFAIWAKVFNLAVWDTDTNFRRVFNIASTADNNSFNIHIRGDTSTLMWFYDTGSDVRPTKASITDVSWIHLAWTISAAGNVCQAYWNGSPQGAPLAHPGNWADALDPLYVLIGARDLDGLSNVWHGWLQHASLFGRPLTPAEVQLAYRARWTR